MPQLLDSINQPSDLKRLGVKELETLAGEIREFLIENISKTGGHLASNLGTVELTLALHYVFDSPNDQLIWDVGHQAYVHKILTGRRDQFGTLRQLDGLSGFPKREESPHDILDTGHSSTSISAALGISIADGLSGRDRFVLPIIGDGALTAGMAYEAMNYAGQCKSRLMVILNDNAMSISGNVGSLSKYLSKIRTMQPYTRTKNFVSRQLSRTAAGNKAHKLLSRTKTGFKELVIPGMLFEHLGFHYMGPVDGHDLRELIRTFRTAQTIDLPILIHVNTVKGKGYRRAELGPDRYHGVSPFNPEKGITPSGTQTFSSVFGGHLASLADQNNHIMAVTAAMIDGTGLSEFSQRHPKRLIDVGIAEQNAVTLAAGLALGGMKPFVSIYSTFLQRAFDQIIHDVALPGLPVTFCIDRSGLVGRDGETHQGIFDTSFLSLVPNLTVLSPKDIPELRAMLDFAIEFSGPLAIKYPREKAYDLGFPVNSELLDPESLRKGKDTCVVTSGRLVREALNLDPSVGVVNLRKIHPLDCDALMPLLSGYKRVLFVEENVETGSFAKTLADRFKNLGLETDMLCLPDRFIEQGSVEELLARYGLDTNGMESRLAAWQVPQ